MAYVATDITTYGFAETDELLLDANIWLFLYGPSPPGDKKVAIYSAAFARMLSAKAALYIDVLVVAEFANRYARILFQLACSSDPKLPTRFKEFRQSAAWGSVAKDVSAGIKQMLKHPSRCEGSFCTIDIAGMIAEFEKGESDFNDLLIEDLCRKEGLKLVTDDADFLGRDIAVITGNKKLIV